MTAHAGDIVAEAAVEHQTLCAVVVTFNRLEKLKVTIDRFLASPVSDLTYLVVVDNASTDGTSTWLASLDDPRVHVYTSESNLGGAGGFEMGMRWAYDNLPTDWMLITDDDGRPMQDTLAEFHNRAEPGWDAYATAVYFPSGEICPINVPSVNPFWDLKTFAKTVRHGRDGFHLADQDFEAASGRDLDATSFVGLFVSREVIEKVGFPQGELFIYGDDVIYTLKIRKAGFRIRFSPALKFEHDFSAFTLDDRRIRPMWKLFYHQRNLSLVYAETAGWWIYLVMLVIVPKWILKGLSYPGERRIFYKLLATALWDAWRGDLSRTHDEIVKMSEGG